MTVRSERKRDIERGQSRRMRENMQRTNLKMEPAPSCQTIDRTRAAPSEGPADGTKKYNMRIPRQDQASCQRIPTEATRKRRRRRPQELRARARRRSQAASCGRPLSAPPPRRRALAGPLRDESCRNILTLLLLLSLIMAALSIAGKPTWRHSEKLVARRHRWRENSFAFRRT